MDLRKYYLENISETEYYYNFYDLNNLTVIRNYAFS